MFPQVLADVLLLLWTWQFVDDENGEKGATWLSK
jgi:hypothetical protein